MQIRLSDHFTLSRLLRFTLPSVVMMAAVSLYSVVDGLFVSNLVGDLALSAVNIVMPIAMIVGAFGFMLGTGGSAIVARTMGEGDRDLANRYFSLFIWCVVGLGAALSLVCVIFMEPIVRLAGASDLLVNDCVTYGRILLAGSVPFMLQTSFQSFFVAAERPHAGLAFSLAAGGTNMVLDYVFIALLDMGVAGAALATAAGYCVGGLIPLIQFLLPGRQGLRIVPTRFYPRQLLHACANGSSELMSNLSSSVVGILYNLQLMALMGEKGVAAYSVMMYVDFVFVAAFLGLRVCTLRAFRASLNWESLLFIGTAMGLATVFSYTGIDTWVVELVGPVMQHLAFSPFTFVVGVALATVALRFIIASEMAFINIFMAFMAPMAVSLGINPWVVGFAVYAMVNPWFMMYQNPIYMAAFYSVDGRMVNHGPMAAYCGVYLAICLAGLLLSIPYWVATGIYAL